MPFDFEPFDDADGSDPFRVRHLIAKLVSESVKDFHLREKDRAFSLLTPEKIEQGLEKGTIWTAPSIRRCRRSKIGFTFCLSTRTRSEASTTW
jgi:hypothetical protein